VKTIGSTTLRTPAARCGTHFSTAARTLLLGATALAWTAACNDGASSPRPGASRQVLFSPEDRYEVEVGGTDYIMLRERDIHAVAASRIDGHTGLYL